MATARPLILLLLCLMEAGDLAANRWTNVYSLASHELNRGDSESARRIAEVAYRSWRGNPTGYWHWPFRLILAESLIEQDRMAEAAPFLEGTAPNAAWEARRMAGIAFIKYRARDSDGVRQALHAAELVNPPDARDVAGKIDLIRGMMNLRQEQPAEAEACFRRALDAVGGTGSLVESYTLTDLGVGDLRSYRNDEAVTWFERARDLAQRSGMKGAVMLSDSNLGVCYRRLGDLDRALKYLEESASIAAGLNDRVNLLRVLDSMGGTTFELGEVAKAQEYFERARRLATSGRDDEWLVTILIDLSEIALTRGDVPGAESLNREAAEVAERLKTPRSHLAVTMQAADIAAARRDYPAAGKLFAEARTLATQLVDPVALWECHAGLASTYRGMGQVSETAKEYGIAIGIIEDERSKLTHDEFKLSFLSRLIRFYDDYVDFLVERGDVAGAFRVAQSSRARLLAEKGHTTGKAEPVVDVKSLQRALQVSHSVILSYWLAPPRSFVWVIDGKSLRVDILPGEDEIGARVRQYAGAIQDGANPLETGSAAGRWLFSNLIPADLRESKARNIVIQPDGALHQLNFESLPAEEGNQYWIEGATVSVAPSLALLRESASPAPRRLLLFGDPESADAGLPPLPNVKTEIAAVSGQYADKALYTGTAATPASYRTAHPESYSTLHFAAHAVPNRDSPLDSAIILGGPADSRKLYARNILAQSLTAELVTLSACETAGTRSYRGEGLMGFSWAFLSAGARNVVAGLWPVDDRATAQLMQRFYQEMAAGRSPSIALRQAKLDLMASGMAYRKPRYWAAFETFTRVLYRQPF